MISSSTSSHGTVFVALCPYTGHIRLCITGCYARVAYQAQDPISSLLMNRSVTFDSLHSCISDVPQIYLDNNVSKMSKKITPNHSLWIKYINRDPEKYMEQEYLVLFVWFYLTPTPDSDSGPMTPISTQALMFKLIQFRFQISTPTPSLTKWKCHFNDWKTYRCIKREKKSEIC